MDAFFDWAKNSSALPQSAAGEAITYALNQRVYLENVLLDGHLEISNNCAEHSVKPFAIGRRYAIRGFRQRRERLRLALFRRRNRQGEWATSL